LGQDRPQLAVVKEMVLTSPADPYLTIKSLAAYSGCSVRWLQDQLRDPFHPLPYYRKAGKVLVRRSEFDAWIARYRQSGKADVDRNVNDALAGLCERA
jgi:hypothetical protein